MAENNPICAGIQKHFARALQEAINQPPILKSIDDAMNNGERRVHLTYQTISQKHVGLASLWDMAIENDCTLQGSFNSPTSPKTLEENSKDEPVVTSYEEERMSRGKIHSRLTLELNPFGRIPSYLNLKDRPELIKPILDMQPALQQINMYYQHKANKPGALGHLLERRKFRLYRHCKMNAFVATNQTSVSSTSQNGVVTALPTQPTQEASLTPFKCNALVPYFLTLTKPIQPLTPKY